MPTTPSVSIVLPALGLGPTIASNIHRVLDSCAILDPQVIVIDDGSEDDTYQQAAAVAKTCPRVEVVRHPRNLGKGEALTSGWKASTADRVVFLDGDLDLPPEQVPQFVTGLESFDIVAGEKRLQMAEGGYPLSRRFMSRGYVLLNRLLFDLPVEETQTGLKAFRRSVLDDILPRVEHRGWAFDLELIVRAHRAGYTITSAPVTVQVSPKGAPVRPSMIYDLAKDSLKMAWKLKRR